jgi:hypothetical protein
MTLNITGLYLTLSVMRLYVTQPNITRHNETQQRGLECNTLHNIIHHNETLNITSLYVTQHNNIHHNETQQKGVTCKPLHKLN